jgi:anti-sigma-K factor RskA
LGCEEYEDRLIEHVLGTLSQNASSELREHLARGCPYCAGQLAELQETLSLLPLGLPETEAPANVRERLLKRARETTAVQKTVPQLAETSGRWWIGAFAASAIAATVLIACGGAWIWQQRTVTRLAAQLTQREQQVADLRNALASEQEVARSIRSPSALMVSLEGAARPAGQGRIFIDPSKGKWWFAARGLQPLHPTRPTSSG